MRVFATRPQAQNTSWSKLLQKENFEVVDCPLMEIISLEESQQRPIVNRVLELDQYHKTIFVSQNAVEHAFRFVQQYWPQLPVGLGWFAVGKKTRALLCQYLEEGSCFFDTPPNKDLMNSEELLSLPELRCVENERIVIFRGVGGRDLIRTTLEARGAEVHYCELYIRRTPEEAERSIKKAAVSDDDVIPIFSGESLENLDRILSNGVAGSAEPTLILPGDRVAALAKGLDYEKIVIAKNASEQEMLRALNSFKNGESPKH